MALFPPLLPVRMNFVIGEVMINHKPQQSPGRVTVLYQLLFIVTIASVHLYHSCQMITHRATENGINNLVGTRLFGKSEAVNWSGTYTISGQQVRQENYCQKKYLK